MIAARTRPLHVWPGGSRGAVGEDSGGSGEVAAANEPADQEAADGRSSVIGVGGAEIYGRVGLLRSFVVADAWRRMGVASAILSRIEEEAVRRGVRRLYLLTESARAFSEASGFETIPRCEAPPEIAATEEFASLCPESATLMVRDLGCR